MTPLLLLRQAIRQRKYRQRILKKLRELKYNPDQPRDDDGRWTDGGGGDSGGDSFSAGRASENLGNLSKFDIPEDLQMYFTDKDMRNNPITTEGTPIGAYGAFTEHRDVLETAMKKAGGFERLLRKAELATVPLNSLTSYQRYVNAHQVKHYIGKMDEVLRREVAVVVRLNGRNWIVDGNHRTAAAILGGAKQGTVKMISLES